MNSRSSFDIDCSPIIPACGFKCPKCIREIESTLTGLKGVSKVYIQKDAQEQKLVVEHDANVVTAGQLVSILKGLPSFHQGFFIPTLLGNTRERD